MHLCIDAYLLIYVYKHMCMCMCITKFRKYIHHLFILRYIHTLAYKDSLLASVLLRPVARDQAEDFGAVGSVKPRAFAFVKCVGPLESHFRTR